MIRQGVPASVAGLGNARVAAGSGAAKTGCGRLFCLGSSAYGGQAADNTRGVISRAGAGAWQRLGPAACRLPP